MRQIVLNIKHSIQDGFFKSKLSSEKNTNEKIRNAKSKRKFVKNCQILQGFLCLVSSEVLTVIHFQLVSFLFSNVDFSFGYFSLH